MRLSVKRSKPESVSIREFYLQTVPEGEPVVKPCGKEDAEYVLVSPHPTDEEKESGIPFATEDGRVWLDKFTAATDVSVDDLLIFPSSVFGKAATVKSTKHTLEICQRLARNRSRTFLFCGAVEFGLTINGFRKKASRGLYGAVMYLPQLIGSRVVVLPSPTGLFPATEEWKDVRDAQYFQSQLVKVFVRLAKNIKIAKEAVHST